MAFYGNERNYVIYPFFKKLIKLPFFETKSQVYDIISPEYLSGPLIKSNNDPKLSKEFLQKFHSWCLENGIVSEFARLHPFIKNDLMVPAEDTIKLYNIVWLDLTADFDIIWKNFEKRCRNAITRAKREEVEVVISDKKSDISNFYSLYIDSMKRAKAAKKYFHPKSFFEDILKIMKEKASLFVAKYDGKVIAGAIFLHSYGFFHYFRAGSDEKFLYKNPNNMILFEAIKWAKERGYKTFVFGGGNPGHGNEFNDSLFRFKSSFSSNFIPVYGYKKNHNPKLYKILCEKKAKYFLKKGLVDDSKYFPKYQLERFPGLRTENY